MAVHRDPTPIEALSDPRALITFLNLADGPATIDTLVRRTGLSKLEVAHHLQRMVEGGLVERERTNPGAGKSVQVLYSVKVEDIDLSGLVPDIRTGYATELLLNKVKGDILEAVNNGTAEDDSKLTYVQIRANPAVFPTWKQKLKELGEVFKEEEDIDNGEESLVLLVMCYRTRSMTREKEGHL